MAADKLWQTFNNIGCGIYDQDIYLLPSISFAKALSVFSKTERRATASGLQIFDYYPAPLPTEPCLRQMVFNSF